MAPRESVSTVLFKILIFCSCAAVSGVLTAKAFYCRDPDTGKFYPVNSTWHSTSFCGHYTCKLRKKTHDQQQTTERNNIGSKPTPTEYDLSKNCTQIVDIIIEDKAKTDTKKLLHKEKENTYVNLEKLKKDDNFKNIELAATIPDEDRYLTEEEITALSLLLQTMKKSDLEAILEVYNLAKDIYQELDKIEDGKAVINDTQNEKLKVPESTQNTIPDEGKDKKIVSYWYEPLTAVNGKLKEANMLATHQEPYVNPLQAKPKPLDMPKSFYEGLNMLADVKNKQKILEMAPKSKMNDKNFIAGPLTSSDFRKLPYYHPLTNFQKQASYVRPTVTYNLPALPQMAYAQSADYPPSEIYSQSRMYPQAYFQLGQYPPLVLYSQQQKETKPFAHQQQEEESSLNYQQHQNSVLSENHRPHVKCCKPELPFKLIPWSNTEKKQIDLKNERKPTYQAEKTYEPKSPPYTDSKITAKNLDFPYAYVQNYNLSSVNPYNSENPWSLLSYGDKNKKYQTPYQGAYAAQLPHEGVNSASISAEMKEEEPIQNTKDSREILDWPTAPLSTKVLNEVKANIAKSKFLPYPFRKKVKLEKVGRLIRLEEAARIKRDVNENVSIKTQANPEEYEAYLEKSTCVTDTEPGFFRMGNTSQPFPACCPQRIRS